MPLVRLFMLWWTANAASAHHFTVPVPSDSKAITRFLMPLIHFRILTSFLSSYLSVSITRVVRNATPIRMLGHTLLHKKIRFATIVCKACEIFFISLHAVSFTSKKWFAAGVIASPYYLLGRSSTIFKGSPSDLFIPCRDCGNPASFPGSSVPFLGGLSVPLISGFLADLTDQSVHRISIYVVDL